jgi:anti-sigma B factor antagonist
MSVKLNTRQVGDVSVIDVSGRLTLGEGATAIREEIHLQLAGGSRKIVMNLADISYIDSSGLGELLAGFRATANTGGKLKLLGLTKSAKEMLRVTRLTGIFEVHEDEASAVKSYA